MSVGKLENLEEIIGVRFHNKDLAKEAFTHRSYLNERPDWPTPHNERLEYLGDAVLELAITESLFKKFPEAPEGQLTVLRAALVNYQMLYRIALEIKLDRHILVSKGERKDTGRGREVILANAMEALIGAIYLDQGFSVTSTFINTHIFKHLEEILLRKTYKDPKSELQEIVQEKLKLTPTYRVLEEDGPAHKRIFRIGVYFGDQLVAEGHGNSKQDAEIEAARQALLMAK